MQITKAVLVTFALVGLAVIGCKQQADRLDPDGAEAYNDQGVAHVENGDLDKAIAEYSEAIRLNPDYAGAYYNRGNAYREWPLALAVYWHCLRRPDMKIHPGAIIDAANTDIFASSNCIVTGLCQ